MSERRIIAYTVRSVMSSGSACNQKIVDDLILDGWQPFGSPTSASTTPGFSYVWQAFVKYDKPEGWRPKTS